MWRVRCVGCVCPCGVVCGVGGVCACLVVAHVCGVVKLGTLSLSLSCSLSCSLSFLLSLSFSPLCLSFPSLFFFCFLCSCSFSCSCSCPCSSSLLPVLLLFLFLFFLLFSPPNFVSRTDQPTNFKAFECELAQGSCTALASHFTA